MYTAFIHTKMRVQLSEVNRVYLQLDVFGGNDLASSDQSNARKQYSQM